MDFSSQLLPAAGGEAGPSASALPQCGCGCIPPNMMSLFQMAELRTKMRERNATELPLFVKLLRSATSPMESTTGAAPAGDGGKDVDGELSSTSSVASAAAADAPLKVELFDRQLTPCRVFVSAFADIALRVVALHLDHNQLTRLPKGLLKSMPNLLDLALHDNKLEILSGEVGNLTQLRSLRLDNNALTLLPEELSLCTSLETLHLDNNPMLMDFPVKLFDNMRNLHHILMERLPHVTRLPRGIVNCDQLQFVCYDGPGTATAAGEVQSRWEDPPHEVMAAGGEAIREYFRGSQ